VAALRHAVVAQFDLDALHLAALVQGIDGAGVDADAHGDAALFTGGNDLFERLAPIDEVARIDAHAVYALANGFKGQGMFIVNIGHQGDVNAFFDGADGQRVLFLRDGDAHDLTPDIF